MMCKLLGFAVLLTITQSARGHEENVVPGRAKTFLVGYVGHTGSTAMMSVMMQHSDLFVPSLEPLTRRQDRLEFTTTVFKNGVKAGKVTGFKIRPTDVSLRTNPEFRDLVAMHDTRYIRLTRENIFKTAMGLYTVRALLDESAVMGLSPEELKMRCKLKPQACYFDIKHLKFFAYLMLRYKMGSDAVSNFGAALPWSCQLNVTYEEFVDDRDATMRKVYSFLGVEDQILMPTFQKVVSDNPCEVISNYQVVCSKLWACDDFRPYLEDPKHNCYCVDTTSTDESLCTMKSLLAGENDFVCQDAEGKDIACSK